MILAVFVGCFCLCCCIACCIDNQNEENEKLPEETPMYNLTSDEKTPDIECLNEQTIRQENSTQRVDEQTDQPKLNPDFPYSFPTYPHNDSPINHSQLPYDAQKDYTRIQPTAPKMETPLLTRKNSDYDNVNEDNRN